MLNQTELYYFSPTGGTKMLGEMVCAGISANVDFVDLGRPGGEVKQPESEVAVFAAPVFAGRIPAVVEERLAEVDGRGKKAVTLAVYGNRAYEDALLELNRVVEARGFSVAASAALVTRHSIVPEVAKDRPDRQDREEIADFAGKVLKKLEEGAGGPVEVPGNYPCKERKAPAAAPVSLAECSRCGKCAGVCPTGAIRMAEGGPFTNPEECIMCMACVRACPESARILPSPVQEGLDRKLGALKAVRRENEYFL